MDYLDRFLFTAVQSNQTYVRGKVNGWLPRRQIVSAGFLQSRQNISMKLTKSFRKNIETTQCLEKDIKRKNIEVIKLTENRTFVPTNYIVAANYFMYFHFFSSLFTFSRSVISLFFTICDFFIILICT